LQVYRRIEDWHGEPDSQRRGQGGPLFVQPAPDPHSIASAGLEAFARAGISTVADHNGAIMEHGSGGAAFKNVAFAMVSGNRSIERASNFLWTVQI
jgi:choline dehydrogenase